MALVLNAKQFAEYHRRLADKFRPTVLRGIRAGAARAVGYLVARTREAPPANPAGKGTGGAVNTGAFVRRWRAVPLPDGAALVNDSPYGPIIEDGRRRGSKFPPRDALIAWIKRKLLAQPRRRRFGPGEGREARRARLEQKRLESRIARFGREDPRQGPKRPEKFGPQRRPKAKPKGRRVKRAPSVDQQAARLYFPIARAISRRGLIGRKILTAPTAKEEILRMVTREVAAELNREMAKR